MTRSTRRPTLATPPAAPMRQSQAHNDKLPTRDDDDELAQIATREERVGRCAGHAPVPAHCVRRVGVVEPEARAVAGVERRRRARAHPALGQDATAVGNAVVQIQQTEPRSVAC